jgi:hypothetical protein
MTRSLLILLSVVLLAGCIEEEASSKVPAPVTKNRPAPVVKDGPAPVVKDAPEGEALTPAKTVKEAIRLVESQEALTATVLESAAMHAEQGMAAFRKWHKARGGGDQGEVDRLNKLARDKLNDAVARADEELDQYRDADGMVRGKYVVWEDRLSDWAKHLIDLEMGAGKGESKQVSPPKIDEKTLNLAAYLGHEPSRKALGPAAPAAVSELGPWIAGLDAWDSTLVVKALVVVAETAIPVYENAHPKDVRPRQVLMAAQKYCELPCPEFAQICAGTSLGAESAAEDANGEAAAAAAWAIHKLAITVYAIETKTPKDTVAVLVGETVEFASKAVQAEQLRDKVKIALMPSVVRGE